MVRSGSPFARATSPAVSEISVGSPSPPLVFRPNNLSQYTGLTAFRPLSIKRARLTEVRNESGASKTERAATLANRLTAQPPQRRKSCAEGVKSFSIADILGNGIASTRSPSPSSTSPRSTTPPPLPRTQSLKPPNDNNCIGVKPPQMLLLPHPQHTPPATLLPAQVLNDRLGTSMSPLVMPPSQLLLDAHGFPKSSAHAWQAMRGATAAIPMRPFLPPALLHYEQRLAWDYQRQLQEHFQAQAQLLRQMSLDPSIIPSEDGSERSHSSSTGSDCCSPGLSAAPTTADGMSATGCQGEEKSGREDAGGNDARKGNAANADGKNRKGVGDTPLDALFQLSTKNFDDGADPATLNIFSTRPNPKKKRKSRTAFTNHQIFELEKRFLYQKYLSPADRDEIAAALGLSNAQVITWFQNRRAKLKRDIEELKKDVDSVKELSGHKSFLENVNDLSILKTRPVSRHQQPPTISIGLPTAPAAASATLIGHTQQSSQFDTSHTPNFALILPTITITHTTTTGPSIASISPTQQTHQCQSGAIDVSTEIAVNQRSISGGNNIEGARSNDRTVSEVNISQSRLQQFNNNSRG